MSLMYKRVPGVYFIREPKDIFDDISSTRKMFEEKLYKTLRPIK